MSSPPQSLIERLLEGLRNVQDPAFIAADFGRNWPDQTSAFLAERIFKKIPPAETPYIPGVGYRQIVTIGGKEYLTDPDAPGSSFEPLDFDLSRLQLDEKRFVQWIADGNSLDDVREFSGAVWLIGKRVLHGWQTNVFYMRPGWDVDRLGQIAALARDTSGGEMFLLVAASFAGISLETLRRVTQSRFATATLFSLVEGERINLEKCQLPPFDQRASDVSNRDVIRHFDRRLDTLGVEYSDLKRENEVMKKNLADQLVAIGHKVDPEFFRWIIVILATGSVNAASKKLGIPNSSFDQKLRGFVARGGLYRTLFGLLGIRKNGVGVKGIEHFNEDYEKHQMDRGSDAASSLLPDILDALEQMNEKNWPKVRSEMIDWIRPEK